MTELRKFSLIKYFFASAMLALFCAITWKSNANSTYGFEIYSTLTRDTIKPEKKDPNLILKISPSQSSADTLPKKTRDTIAKSLTAGGDSILQKVDTFSLKLSKDSLDAPLQYEAEDSAVILVKEKKITLYGKAKTTYTDVIVTAPQISLDQENDLLSAISSRDSAGELITRVHFEQGANKFDADSFQFNTKSQKGLIKNTITTQDEMFVHGETVKKVDANTYFIKNARFTTCNLDEPHFDFLTGRMKVINNKVAISGPTHPEFEGVPIPIYLPFGYFPLTKGRHSGLLPPQFTTNQDFGLGLEGLGYYKVLNENYDVTLRGNIYSYGGWSVNLLPSYRKRYKYNGAFNLSLQHTKFNFKGDPDYNLIKTFNIYWNHSVDQRARPGTSFSANVNAGSTKYNQYIPNNPNRNFQNRLNSSIAYSKTWKDKPYNLTLSANHTQNNADRLVSLTIPDAGFTVNTIYPFQRKDIIGSPKWYEKLGIGYNGTLRNQVSFYDTGHVQLKQIIDTLQWGAQHRIPISLSLPPVGPFLVSPSISYEEKWLGFTFRRKWNDAKKKVDTVINKGIYTDRQVAFGVGFNTSIYGTYVFKHSSIKAIRHVVRPSFSFNYRPDLSKKHYYTTRVNTAGDYRQFSEFEGTLFGGYSMGSFGGISFGVDNNLEMKWKSRKDTSSAEPKRVRLIDGFGFNTGYNFIADSFKLSPLQLYFRSVLFEKVNLTAQATVDPYNVGPTGNPVDRFVWQGGRFTPGRLTGGSVSLSTDFRSKPKDPEKDKQNKKSAATAMTDPSLLGDQERLQDYMRRNPAEFVDFNIPWTISLSFSLYFSKVLKPDYSGYQNEFNANTSFNTSFSLTPKWNFTTNGYYDFKTWKIQTFTMSISREMHCWQMSIGVTPIGQYRFFNITINPKSSILQDLRINRTRTFYNY